MKKFVYFSVVIAGLFVISCKKTSPATPVPDNTPAASVTLTMTALPSVISTDTFTATITDTVTMTATETITPTSTVTMTATNTSTPLETATALLPGADYSFSTAGDLSVWQASFNDLAFDNTVYFDPPGSMSSVVNNNFPEIFSFFPMVPINVIGHKLSFYMKCPPELAGYEIMIQMTSYSFSEYFKTVGYADGSGQWQHFVWDTAANPPSIGVQMDLETLNIWVSRGTLPYMPGGTVYLDSVDFDY